MLIFAGRPPGGLGNMGFAAVLVAPASGDVLGVIDVDRTPAYAALFLHRDLWTGETGRVISGVMAVGTLLLLVIGTYLWWPSTARLGRKLSGRPWRITLTRSRPLHDWVGVWTLVLLTILVVSGLALVQPSWVAPVLDAVAGPEPDTVAAADAPCADPIGFDAALARAQALAPSNGFKSLYPVDAEFRRWEIVLEGDDPDAGSDDTHVAVDTRCGTVAVEGTPATRSAHEAAELWLSDAHDGVAFGAAGPVLVSLCGLSPLVLLWSGILMWNRGRHARRKAALRRGESVTA